MTPERIYKIYFFIDRDSEFSANVGILILQITVLSVFDVLNVTVITNFKFYLNNFYKIVILECFPIFYYLLLQAKI